MARYSALALSKGLSDEPLQAISRHRVAAGFTNRYTQTSAAAVVLAHIKREHSIACPKVAGQDRFELPVADEPFGLW